MTWAGVVAGTNTFSLVPVRDEGKGYEGSVEGVGAHQECWSIGLGGADITIILDWNHERLVYEAIRNPQCDRGARRRVRRSGHSRTKLR